MKAIFQDLQQLDNPLNGSRFESADSITNALNVLRDREPFLFELQGDNNFMLTVGLAGDCGSVQYSSRDGMPPYLMATSEKSIDDGGFVEFLAGNTPTPISRRFCLPMNLVQQIASEFVERGDKSETVNWEEI